MWMRVTAVMGVRASAWEKNVCTCVWDRESWWECEWVNVTKSGKICEWVRGREGGGQRREWVDV